MPRHAKDDKKDQSFTLRFGGGVNTRKVSEDIDPTEAVVLTNAYIDIDRRSLMCRPPIKNLIGTPNGVCKGFAQLVATQDDGLKRVSTIVQIHDTLYKYAQTPGSNTFSWQAAYTVSPNSRLRGEVHNNYELDRKVIITDLELETPVLTWDGDTVEPLQHNLRGPSNQPVDFYAKYCVIEDERAWFGNVRTDISGGADTRVPHMVVASARSDIESLSVASQPSSALGAADPFYVLSPDLKPIEALVSAYSSFIIATSNGRIYRLNGSSSKDFFIEAFFSGASVTKENQMALAGNDVLFINSQGKVDSLAGVEAFGDVEVDNISRPLEKSVSRSFQARSCQYNVTDSILYVNPNNFARNDYAGLWAFFKSMHDQQAKDVSLLRQGTPLSPWVFWTVDGTFTNGAFHNPFDTSDLWQMYPIRNTDEGFQPPEFLPSKVLALGGTNGVIKYIPNRERAEAELTFQGTNSDVTDDGFVPVRMNYVSKTMKSPSVKGFENMTGVLHFSANTRGHLNIGPLETRFATCDLKIVTKGTRHSSHEISLVLEQKDIDNESSGFSLSQSSLGFSLACLQDAIYFHIELDINTNGHFVEILGIDFNVES